MKGKTICKTLGLVLLALLILVVLYVVYVFASYHRIGDSQHNNKQQANCIAKGIA